MGLFKYLIKYTEVSKDHPNGRPGRSAWADGNTKAEAFSNLRKKSNSGSNKGKGIKYTDLQLVKKQEKH